MNFNRRDRVAEPNQGVKAALTTATGHPNPVHTTTSGGLAPAGVVSRQPRPGLPVREGTQPLPSMARDHAPGDSTSAAPRASDNAAAENRAAEGSKLFIGVNILLKGVEISNCDVLVIEGNVEATINSKVMEIAAPGTLKGTALIDVAEIHGDFSGDLTARTRLVVHGTGRVQGTIRYGKLVVAEGGELSGDIKCLDESSRRKPTQTPLIDTPSTQPVAQA
jgi:cytoskeletal protein CcmA (bactofilin family)